MSDALGDFIAGTFVPATGETLVSTNPATGATVFETPWSPDGIDAACEAAAAAAPAWGRRSLDERFDALTRFRDALTERRAALADAICDEVGKVHAEANIEVGALISRFAGVLGQIRSDLQSQTVPGHPTETLRYHAHGVVGVIGPYNFPLHLCHAHVVPALLMGNAVVIKPSEVAPLSGQLYAEAAAAAGLPDGVFNLVQGGGAAGAALTNNPHVRALAFTGSWPTGRRILSATLDRPEVLVALEMGGKNTVVVMPDADLRQVVHDLLVGAYLTTGQRCTCTDRVLVHRDVADALVAALRPAVESLHFGDPRDPASFAGPLASDAALEGYEASLKTARDGGAEVIVPHERFGAGSYARASLYRVPDGQFIDGYSNLEVFGPNLAVQAFGDVDEAVEILRSSPYGLANAVYTRDDDVFEHLYRSVHCGIWNRNRTTNQASPRLPFGGVGHSGNFRPAGAFAARNVSYPVAVIQKAAGNVVAHDKLVDHLPPVDLDALAARHLAEEEAEAARRLTSQPRPLRVSVPRDGELPTSEHWLERFYAGDRIAREKKPGVYDHLRSSGPWFVSVDEQPMSVLDGMSQTATVSGGFAHDDAADAWATGGFGDTALRSPDTSVVDHPAAHAFADTLRELVPGLPHVTFTNSGAEANEKALALCALHRPGTRRVLAFEGGFHGRTLLALHATYNPVKRGPFELAGYECTFAPYPLRANAGAPEPRDPDGFLKHLATGDLTTFAASFRGDPSLDADVAALVAVHEALDAEPHTAVVIEPMQSEGGDRYATARFYRGLRVLTRRHDVPLIFDEVQVGFGLGGPFAWFELFGLVDADGAPDRPDCVVFAKRAQVGVVMSCWDDPEPTASHPASMVRGRLHAELARTPDEARRVQSLWRPHLERIARQYPHLVSNPRGLGFAFAFDLPDTDTLLRYIPQRFWRGAIVFAAGQRTVRYRLSTAFDATEIDRLFEAVRRSLAWLDANPGHKPPAWQDDPNHKPAGPLRTLAPNFRVREIEPHEAESTLDAVVALEARVYEPVRRDPRKKLALAFEDGGVAIVAEQQTDDGWVFVGSALACPLEHVGHLMGPKSDPNLGTGNTLYSLALTVDPDLHGHGLGRALKAEQIRAAARREREDGAPRYRWMAGRNRVGHTDPMVRLNTRFGAHVVEITDNDYGGAGHAMYYRLPIGPLAPSAAATIEPSMRLDDGIATPLSLPPASLRAREADGTLAGPAITKVTICNYITPAIVRATEFAGALAPDLPHMYLTSCRDELLDKSVRLMKYHRKAGRIVIGLDGGYVGHTTAAARSVSDPKVHRAGEPWFDWPRVPHPADGIEATIAALDAAVEATGGADQVLALVVEPLQERTGRALDADAWHALDAWRAHTGVPIVAIETASTVWRTGLGPFAVSTAPARPDVLAWWAGGQTGFMHVSPRLFVGKPLTFVSTWDGDELSMVRLHHTLRAARSLDLTAAIDAMDGAMDALAAHGVTSTGRGLYRVLTPEDPARFAAAAQELCVHLRPFAHGAFGVAPPLDVAIDSLAPLHELATHLGR